ncbi:MAG: hypothetical protein H6825_06955 [Planctomycetes bacterium]|nr:hypothetical protein [Planctomycetota bacterium]
MNSDAAQEPTIQADVARGPDANPEAPTTATDPTNPPSTALDASTAADLELARLVERADETLTTPGAVVFAEMLGTPLVDAEALRVRAAQLDAFEERGGERTAIRATLAKLGRSAYPEGLVHWVREPLPDAPAGMWLHSVLALLMVASIVNGVLRGNGAWGLVMLLLLGNMALHYQTRRGIELYIDTLRELGRLVACGRRLSQKPMPGAEDLFASLHGRAATLARLARLTATLLPTRGGTTDALVGIAEYVSIAFLVETRAYAKVLREMRKHRDALAGLFDEVGLIDALQAGALFRQAMPKRCTPVFVDDPARLEALGLVHPLIDDAVPNDLLLEGRCVVISGSNMSGKSTFLRAVGLNALLAQTLCACAAERWTSSRFRIVSSMSISDDLGHGLSFYYAEAERILGMVRLAGEGTPALCLVDELLRGTNSAERLAASEEILRWIADHGALVLVTTHDLELIGVLAERYDAYHFTDAHADDALAFDYLLRPGTAGTRNAIRLLAHLGFPAEIVERARARVDEG